MNFRADFFVRDSLKAVRHYSADDATHALESARQQVVALGVEHADVWEPDGHGGATYIGNVEAER